MHMFKAILMALTLSFAGSYALADSIPLDQFSITNGTDTISWVLAASPAVTWSADSSYFSIYGVPITVDGVQKTASEIDFYKSAADGGLDIIATLVSSRQTFSYSVLDSTGSQLFTLSGGEPAFSTGSFSLADNGDSAYKGPYTLTVVADAQPAAATPEPGSLLLLGTGLLGLVGLARRKLQA